MLLEPDPSSLVEQCLAAIREELPAAADKPAEVRAPEGHRRGGGAVGRKDHRPDIERRGREGGRRASPSPKARTKFGREQRDRWLSVTQLPGLARSSKCSLG